MARLRILLCSLALILTCKHIGFSQNKKGYQNFSAGIGIASNLKLGDYPDHEFGFIIMKNPIVQYKLSVVNRTSMPTLHIGYSYAVDKKLNLGLTAAYEKLTGSFKQDSEIVGNYEHQYVTIGLEAKYLYLNKPGFSLYGTLGLGSLIYSQKDEFPQASVFINGKSYDLIAFISPIGLRVGKQLGAFMEAGFGYKGIVNAGISYRL